MMTSNTSARTRARKRVAQVLAAMGGVACLVAASGVVASPADRAALAANWRDAIAHVPAPDDGGCHTARYPSLAWTKVECVEAPDIPFIPMRGHDGGARTVGDGHDYAIQTKSRIASAVGSFPMVKGVTSETGEGKANAYTLQLNSEFYNGPVCAGAKVPSQCLSWLQYVYYTNGKKGVAFMQYWLIHWNTTCPAKWHTFSGDCYKNSHAVAAAQAPITDLAQLAITGSAVKDGLDTSIFTDGANAYQTTGKDRVVDLASAWNGAEFNVIGPGSGSEADFNTGSKMTVQIAVDDGSTKKPVCLPDAGTTGETNNLNLGTCKAKAGDTPYISFVQSN
jgi:hypothetical protein